MKTGRNESCPCGSGKKFKKCCLGKARVSAPSSPTASPPEAATTVASQQSRTWINLAPTEVRAPAPTEGRSPAPPPRSPDPLQEKRDAIWSEFGSQHGEAREGVFLRTLDDNELMDDEAAFEMLNGLHQDGVARGERERFARMVAILAERRPELYQKSAHYYLSWQLLDALVDDRPDVLSLTRDLAAKTGRDIDIVNQGLVALAYHGRLAPLVDAMRIGWPLVQESEKVMGWAIGKFAEAGAAYEIYAYLDSASCPDPSNDELLERIRYFIEDPRRDYLNEFIRDLAGTSDCDWKVADFVLRPIKKRRRRDEWDDDEADKPAADRGSRNLFRLITQFVGYLRRVEKVPYPRGELIRHPLHDYFIQRHRGDLDPQLSMLERAVGVKKKLSSPPKPSHQLCPERVTFEACLAQMFHFMFAQHHKAAALFEAIPAWLRFLRSKTLIDDAQHARTLEELRPLRDSVLKLMENYLEDPTLFRSLKEWPDAP